MSWFFKGKDVVIKALEKFVISPADPVGNLCAGQISVDPETNKLKVWNPDLNRWIINGDASDDFFDNSTNGFASNNVQSAIEEAKNTAEGKARWLASPGFDGTASVGRYLEFSSNVNSNQSGLVVPRSASLKELSLALNTSGTITFTIYKWNGSAETSLTTISTSSSRKSIVTGLDILLNSNDELRVKCTSGSGSRPILYMFFQNT